MRQMFKWQATPSQTDVFSDSDWGGERPTRRSTSGGCVMRGSHCVKTWSKAQPMVTLSSAKAELVAGTKAAVKGLGFHNTLRDLGRKGDIRLIMDASAAIGMIGRRGNGSAKHIDTKVMWLQGCVRRTEIQLFKIGTKENPADLMTTCLTEEEMTKHMNWMGFRYVQ